MKQGILYRFLVRWLVCSLGLWLAAVLLGSRIQYEDGARGIIVAGLILALINAVIKPIVVLLSLPAILFTLGLFMVVINGFTVFLVSKLYTSLHVKNFWTAIIAGIVIGLVNYLVTAILDNRGNKKNERL
jgi:putative membrane protein